MVNISDKGMTTLSKTECFDYNSIKFLKNILQNAII